MGETASRGVLSREALRVAVLADPPLVQAYQDLESQLQPNGFDLTLAEIQRFTEGGALGIDNADRRLPTLAPVERDASGFALLDPGAYHITYNEIVTLPNDLMALGRPRSSLCRCGATIHTAVWDAGYSGRSTSLMTVDNLHGFRLQIGARVMQLVFMRLEQAVDAGYAGVYQGENVKR